MDQLKQGLPTEVENDSLEAMISSHKQREVSCLIACLGGCCKLPAILQNALWSPSRIWSSKEKDLLRGQDNVQAVSGDAIKERIKFMRDKQSVGVEKCTLLDNLLYSIENILENERKFWGEWENLLGKEKGEDGSLENLLYELSKHAPP